MEIDQHGPKRLAPIDEIKMVCGRLYSKHGKELWRIKSFCSVPTVTMENIETKDTLHFGLGGTIHTAFSELPIQFDPVTKIVFITDDRQKTQNDQTPKGTSLPG